MKIEEILEKWYESKNKIEKLEEKIKKYKYFITKELNSQGQEKIKTQNFIVSRRRITKTLLSKEMVPKEIWSKYSNKIHFDSLYLSKR